MDDDKSSQVLASDEALVTALAAATAEIASLPSGSDRDQRTRELSTLLVGTSDHVQTFAAQQCPDVLSAEPFPDTRLHPSEQEFASRLSSSDLEIIDDALVGNSSPSWQKVSRVIGAAMVTLNGKLSEIPLGVYVQRIGELVEVGTLVAEGDIKFIRLSKIKTADSGGTAA